MLKVNDLENHLKMFPSERNSLPCGSPPSPYEYFVGSVRDCGIPILEKRAVEFHTSVRADMSTWEMVMRKSIALNTRPDALTEYMVASYLRHSFEADLGDLLEESVLHCLKIVLFDIMYPASEGWGF